MRKVEDYMVIAARLVLGGLFIYASIHKIADPESFAKMVRNYQTLPPEWTNVVALTLPWVEAIAGVFLVIGFQTRPSALIIAGMMTVFTVALVQAYAAGLDISCGCFSSDPASSGRITLWTILRDTSLLPLAIFVLIRDRGFLALDGFHRPCPAP